ncbi:hypothetical protein TVAGG3_0420280, partial [Trichomonas vaginalis G3]
NGYKNIYLETSLFHMDKLYLKSLNRKLRKESCKQYAKTQIQTMTKSF